ncbi:hypothetical protein AGMMS49960_10510 [Betaproteobacteria bacterium]|nr:hypothetical protein AGMMS49960_10510 [Betaproteobacteria bacterium]GHU23699.1 hypothetical protein AGMMS50243_25590 [Betaproteobacteria bacterium]
MTKKEIKNRVKELLASGVAKAEVFKQLQNQGVNDNKLAFFIAIYADPVRCSEHDGKVNTLVTLMFVLAFIGFLYGWMLGKEVGAPLLIAMIAGSIPLAFAFGFYRNAAGAYMTYIILQIAGISRNFREWSADFAAEPVVTGISIAVTAGLFFYVIYVQSKLFPDLVLFSPKKVKGQYVFTD